LASEGNPSAVDRGPCRQSSPAPGPHVGCVGSGGLGGRGDGVVAVERSGALLGVVLVCFGGVLLWVTVVCLGCRVRVGDVFGDVVHGSCFCGSIGVLVSMFGSVL